MAIQEKHGAIKNLQTINEDLSSYVSSLSGWGLQMYSTDARVWCKVHKNDHWKMYLDLDYHHCSELKRTLKPGPHLRRKHKHRHKHKHKRSLCASEDGHHISISISISLSKPCVPRMLMLMLMSL